MIDVPSVVNMINYEVDQNLFYVYQLITRATLPSSHRHGTYMDRYKNPVRNSKTDFDLLWNESLKFF